MFGLGFWEIIVVFLVILVVVKPEDLPKLAHKIGEGYHKMTRYYYALIDELNALYPDSWKNK